MSRPRSRWPTVAAVLLAAAARAAAEGPTTDPMRSPVPRRPTVRSPIKDDEYADRYAAAVRRLGPVPADAPVGGVRLLIVDVGGPAAKAGLRVGDVVTAVDGKPVGGLADYDRLRVAATGPQMLAVLGGDKARSVTVPPGDLEIRVTDAWLLEGQYLHDLPPGVAPLEAVRVACRLAATDPPLAESALAHVAAGPAAPAATVDVIAAAIAAAGCRYDAALGFAMDARPGLPPDEARRVDALAARMALATFRWPLAADLGVADPFVRDLAAAHVTRPHPAAEPDPFSAADDLPFVDQTKSLTNVATTDNGERASSRDVLRELRQDGVANISVPEDAYATAHCGPAGADVYLTMRCKYRSTRDRDNGYDRAMTVALRGPGGRSAVELTLYVGGQTTVSVEGHRVVDLDLAWPERDGRGFDVRATVVGDRCAVLVAGHRIYYGPVPTDLADEAGRQLTASVRSDSLTGEIKAFHWRTLPPRTR